MKQNRRKKRRKEEEERNMITRRIGKEGIEGKKENKIGR